MSQQPSHRHGRPSGSDRRSVATQTHIEDHVALKGEVLYGRNAVHEALRAGKRRVRRVWATERALREPWLAGGPGRPSVERASPEELERRCESTGHQGVCALVDPYPYADAEALLDVADPFLVVLDEVQDVQNLGAICRTAECAGATGVVIPERRSAAVTPAACKASAGAVEHLSVARVRNVADFLEAVKVRGVWCYGAAVTGAVPWTRPDYSGGVVVVLGAEDKGLRPRVSAACDQLVALPLHGRIDSLNVSAAAAVLLYEIVRTRA
jgi:23S rRNA (guanosine2251-2'-O)-methyltransferase